MKLDIESARSEYVDEVDLNKKSPPAPDEKYSKKDDGFARVYNLLFCFIGLQVSYIGWGVVQEYLMTTEYKPGKFKSSQFCVFANRFLALVIALIIVLVRRIMNPSQAPKEVPFYYFVPSSFSNTLSSWAQYEALKYVSFPTQVLSKSCKIIPVMLVSSSNYMKIYSWNDRFVFIGWSLAESQVLSST
jgi:adenosine 3'-phospho 5'-phosphosulfate transporter B2